MRTCLRALASLLVITVSSGWCADPPDFKESWLKLYKTGDPRERSTAIEYLGFPYCTTKEGMAHLQLLARDGVRDSSPLVRETALARLRFVLSPDHHGECRADDELIAALLKLLKDPSARVREESVRNLGIVGTEKALVEIISLLHDQDFAVRQQAVVALGRIGDTQAIPALLTILSEHKDWMESIIQQDVLYSLRKIISSNQSIYITRRPQGDKREEKFLMESESFENITTAMVRVADDPYLRSDAFEFFSRYATLDATAILQSATKDQDPNIRKMAHLGIALLNSQKPAKNTCGFERIQSALHDPSPAVRAATFSELITCRGQIDANTLSLELANGINDNSREVSSAAVSVSPAIGGKDVIDALVNQFSKPDHDVRRKAMEALLSTVNNKFEGSEAITHTSFSPAEKMPSGSRNSRQRRGVVAIQGRPPKQMVGPSTPVKEIPPTESNALESLAVDLIIERLHSIHFQGRDTAIETLGRLNDPRIKTIAMSLLDDPTPGVQSCAIYYLATKFDMEAITPQLLKFAQEKDRELRRTALLALLNIEKFPEGYSLMSIADNPDPDIRNALAYETNYYKSIHDKKIRPDLNNLMLHMLDDQDAKVRQKAASYFRNNPDKRVVDKLARILAIDGPCSGVAEALAVQGDLRGSDGLYEVGTGRCDVKSSNDNPGRRAAAAVALSKVNDPRAVPLMCELLERGNSDDGQLINGLGATRDKKAASCLVSYGRKIKNGRRVMYSLGMIASPESIDFLKENLEIYQYDQMAYMDVVSVIWKIPGTQSLDILTDIYLRGKMPLFDQYSQASPLVSRVRTDQQALLYLLGKAGKDPVKYESVARALIENINGSTLNSRIVALANDADITTRKGAIIALGASKEKSAILALEKLATDNDEEIKALASKSLERVKSLK